MTFAVVAAVVYRYDLYSRTLLDGITGAGSFDLEEHHCGYSIETWYVST
jgi:hypothetical protein